ncbi:A-kinase anchor protein 1, mitochondrial [Eubalaena glacialis]|uniref:A-kinase anchor protein 1, mitochondrial n=1 Tax=Eubalaena glacialis TaxID=27606 RepID=UPI002A5AB8A5|nr:A-kinase anchor protein 1, mitochondrial [Eubalaena glacialis]XP_061031953.1 A-kinase anchor protein 1, mitochondrial [Eubalaena glacialis]XP_061031954.1 A-kinase anchor protein 1, mitochondrial [Eubalaena glacialis]XP_061031955.1 A-kinase anchor protein 1, mitochondrial [Eubalaena glacialis]XP_061031956.1 A-kinase anchor protein 1, mitochondrial [Eubalaena glacialis]
MAIQLRSLFPLALPGVLALLGWWWFFSRKKEHISNHNQQMGASAVKLRAGPAAEEAVPVEDPSPGAVAPPPAATQPPERELRTASKPPGEPPALLRAHPAYRRSESSRGLPSTADTRFRPGPRKEDSARVELALTGDEAKSAPLECPLPSPKGVPFPHEAAEVCNRETVMGRPAGWRRQGPPAAPAEKVGPGEKTREMGGAEGTGDAVMGENVLEEGPVSQEQGPELPSSRAPSLAPLGGGGEKGRSSLLAVGEDPVGQLLSSYVESAHSELATPDETPTPRVRGSRGWDGDFSRELGKEETLDKNEKVEQAAFQIISKVILEATEEVLTTTMGRITGRMYQASAAQPQGLKEEESCARANQKTALGQHAAEPALAAAEAATGPAGAAFPSADLLAEDLPPPKTYVSCLTSPLSSPTKDRKPKNSTYHVSLAPHPPPAAPLGESLDEASILAEDAACVTCMSNNGQGVPSVASSGQCSDSVSTSGLEDSCTETTSSPRDKATTPLLPESTVPFSNGVLKGELSDLGAEDGWTVDAEADHSGGSDGNSMDSVDSCCGLRKPDGFQNAQAGSHPKKVDLTVWEIEVPKHLVGRLIGKQGRYVSFLKQTSGAKIYISTLPYTQNIQICHIEGSQHHVDKALSLIGKKFKELNLTNIYAPPLPSLALPSLPMTSWLMLPDGITVEVIVVNQVNAGHLFVQQHTHPTFHALRSLDQQMYLCYSQPGIPTLPTPVEITVICAAPGMDGAWWRAQVVASYEETNEVEIRYVDYGGYKRVKVDVLRQIRSDFVTLPFQGAEVLLDSVMPLSDDDHFSPEADAAVSEMTGNTALLAQVTSYSPAGLPLIQLWSVIGDEVVLINRSLVERGLAQWVDSYYSSL